MCVNNFSLLLRRLLDACLVLTSRRSRGRSAWGFAAACLVLGGMTASCATAAHGFRLNPEEEPEQYRVTCKKRFYYCELQARELCDGEYTELQRLSNLPELPLVKDADVSSTGPSTGVQYWQGELTVQCGRLLPNLPLVRQDAPSTMPAVAPAPVPAPVDTPASSRVCIPGATQQCFGPGACKGAQACLESGQGYGSCDCGPGFTVAPSPGAAAPSSSPEAPPLVSTPPGAGNPPAVSNEATELGR